MPPTKPKTSGSLEGRSFPFGICENQIGGEDRHPVRQPCTRMHRCGHIPEYGNVTSTVIWMKYTRAECGKTRQTTGQCLMGIRTRCEGCNKLWEFGRVSHPLPPSTKNLKNGTIREDMKPIGLRRGCIKATTKQPEVGRIQGVTTQTVEHFQERWSKFDRY